MRKTYETPADFIRARAGLGNLILNYLLIIIITLFVQLINVVIIL